MTTPDDVQVKKSTRALRIRAPGHGKHLSRIRSMVADLARQLGFPETEVGKIEMSVGEACENVLEHAYAPDKQWCWQHLQPEIRLEIRTENGQLVVEINDHGQRFDFTGFRPADLRESISQARPGGYGIPIMRQFMDEVQYSSNNETGNTLRLVKYLKKS
jgi:serine/threonine-protein kinase RsbW